MEDDRAGEPVARHDEVPEVIAGIVAAVVENAEGAFAGCNKEASAADSNIAVVNTLAGHNTGIEDAKGDRTGQNLAGAGRAAGLVAVAAAVAVALAVALAAALAAALAGPDGFEGVDMSGRGRIRRPPR